MRQFSGTDPGNIANSQVSIIAKKGAEDEFFSNFFCNVVLLEVFYHNYMFGWKLCSKLNFNAIFLILANFASFLDHAKENADMTKNDG